MFLGLKREWNARKKVSRIKNRKTLRDKKKTHKTQVFHLPWIWNERKEQKGHFQQKLKWLS